MPETILYLARTPDQTRIVKTRSQAARAMRDWVRRQERRGNQCLPVKGGFRAVDSRAAIILCEYEYEPSQL